MRRREAISLLTVGAGLSFAFPAQAQRARKLIAYFAQAKTQHLVDAFNKGLRDLSYVDGKSITVEYYFAEEQGQALDVVAARLVELVPDAIVVVGTAATVQAKRATTIIPIIFAPAGDPVRFGLVPSLGSPGGNLTGVSLFTSELNEKRLEVFKEAFSDIHRVGALWNSNNSRGAQYFEDARSAGERLGLDVISMMTRGLGDLEENFVVTRGERLDGLIVLTDAEFDAGREQIVRLAAAYRIPAMYEHRAFIDVGGLISYGPNIDQLSYRAAAYVDKILKGAKPADLPIEQPTRFELVINLKTAKALGLTIPSSFLLRADEVIE
jgi:putative ABC transport system substrate-binding protein